MARLNVYEDDDDEYSLVTGTTGTSRRATLQSRALAQSPAPSASVSDKENHDTTRRRSGNKQKSVSMDSTAEQSPRPNKKRRLTDREIVGPSQRTHRKQLQEAGDGRYYDPNQSMAERRKVRKEYRDLTRDLTGGHFH